MLKAMRRQRMILEIDMCVIVFKGKTGEKQDLRQTPCQKILRVVHSRVMPMPPSDCTLLLLGHGSHYHASSSRPIREHAARVRE